MIAANFRKYPEAQLLQLELDLAGVVVADDEQRAAFWSWLLATGTRIDLPRPIIGAWWASAKKRAIDLAKAVKNALMAFVFNQE